MGDGISVVVGLFSMSKYKKKSTWQVSGTSKQHVSSGLELRAATLTSLFTPVKIDGDPSGQTCEGGWEGRGGQKTEGGVGGAGVRQKASHILARTTPPPYDPRHMPKHTRTRVGTAEG